MQTAKDEAIAELAAVIKKHNIVIRFSCSDSSDTHALYGERIVVSIGRDDILSAKGWSMNKGNFNV